jgi:small subunit ribosomal protein S16
MAVVIRMKRTGRRNRPCYRISVADQRAPRDGRTIERLGLYDPIATDKARQVTLDVERARHWISVGAVPSPTVRSIFLRFGVYEGLSTAKEKRDRSGRKRVTLTGQRRSAAKSERAQRKATRSTERRAARKASAPEKVGAEA